MRTLPDLDIDDSDFPVLEPGIYSFKTVSAEDKTSKAGNSMLRIGLVVYDPKKDTKVNVWDYLIASETMEWKTRHFCSATGIVDKYTSGELTPFDLTDTVGRCKLIIEESDKYGKSNKVADYIAGDIADIGIGESEAATDDDDSIPF